MFNKKAVFEDLKKNFTCVSYRLRAISNADVAISRWESIISFEVSNKKKFDRNKKVIFSADAVGDALNSKMNTKHITKSDRNADIRIKNGAKDKVILQVVVVVREYQKHINEALFLEALHN